MTEAVAFSIVAVLCLAGWAWTLAVFTRGVVPIANAMKLHQAIVQREDDKVTSLYDRAMRLRNRGATPPPSSTPIVAPPTGPMADIFRGGTMDAGLGIGDQPDAEDVEIVDQA